MEPQLIELSNGLRLIHRRQVHTQLVHLALIFPVGSRDDPPERAGAAHFIEHMLFKGTERRRAYHILNRLDAVGGDLNAFTTREFTAYQATIAREHLGRALELLADIGFRSTFPPKEIEKERQVIFDELAMYADLPEDRIFDEFEALLFPGDTLGHPILGTEDSLAAIQRPDLLAFYQSHYTAGNALLSVVGDVPAGRLQAMAERYFAPYNGQAPALNRQVPTPPPPERRALAIPHQQAHLILGGRAYSAGHAQYPALALMSNYLGGNTMNNRLSMEIRERHGLTYNLFSFQSGYEDTGFWGVYAATEPARIERVTELIRRELQRVADTRLSPRKVAEIKKQFIGQLKIAHESFSGQMMQQARDYQLFGRFYSLEDVVALAEAVTAEDLRQVAEELMSPGRLHHLELLPGEQIPNSK